MRLAPSLLHGLNLGETLYELNRLEEAERVLREALVIEPRSTDVKELLAAVLAAQDRYDDALTLLRELCALKPVALSSRVWLAGVLMEAGRLEEALQEAIAVGEAEPSDPRSHVVLGSIYVTFPSQRRCARTRELVTNSPSGSTDGLIDTNSAVPSRRETTFSTLIIRISHTAALTLGQPMPSQSA